MGVLQAAFLLSIFWCQIQTAPVTDKECPNNISYILGDKCYSLHTDFYFNYQDAVAHCDYYGGTLWSGTSKEEIKFLRKIQAKQGFIYWIGAHEEGHNWKYLSDDSPVSESLIKAQKHRQNQCLSIKHNQHKMKALPCKHNLYTVCEYTDEICEIRKEEGKTCYEFTNTEEDFDTATTTCKNLGARIVEVRNSHQLDKLKETIRQDKAFEDIPEDKLDKLDNSRFPILWHQKQVSENENACLIYQDWEIQTADCTGSRNFACKFDAIPEKLPSITVNAHKEEGDFPEEIPTIIMDYGTPEVSTTTTTLIIIMVIMIVILIVAVAFLVHRLKRAGNRGNGNHGADTERFNIHN